MSRPLTDDETKDKIVKPIEKSWVVSVNQEVRKALDSIEVPEKHEPVDNAFYFARGEAIDEYTANIKEVRKRYE